MSISPLVGQEIRRLLVTELGRDKTNEIIEALKGEKIPLDQITASDIPKACVVFDKLLQGETSFYQRRRLVMLIKKIKPVWELEDMQEQAVMSRNTRREVDILMEIGNLEHMNNDSKSAVKTYRKAIQLADRIKYPEKKTEALVHLAEAQMKMTDWARASKNFKIALTLAQKSGNRLYEVKALEGLGSIKWKLGKVDEHFDCLNAGLNIAEEHNLSESAIEVLNTLGMISMNEGDFATARSYYERAIPHLEKANKELFFASVYNNLGDTYLQTEQPEEAIEHFERCRQSAERMHNEKWIAWSSFNIGEALTMKGDADGCIEACKEAFPLLESINDRYGTMCAYRTIAIGYSLNEDWEAVDDSLQKGNEILEELKSPFQSGYFYYVWGQIENRRGNRKAAGEKLEHAKTLFKDLGYDFYVTKVNKALKEL